jgi:hypothetical protein
MSEIEVSEKKIPNVAKQVRGRRGYVKWLAIWNFFWSRTKFPAPECSAGLITAHENTDPDRTG